MDKGDYIAFIEFLHEASEVSMYALQPKIYEMGKGELFQQEIR